MEERKKIPLNETMKSVIETYQYESALMLRE